MRLAPLSAGATVVLCPPGDFSETLVQFLSGFLSRLTGARPSAQALPSQERSAPSPRRCPGPGAGLPCPARGDMDLEPRLPWLRPWAFPQGSFRRAPAGEPVPDFLDFRDSDSFGRKGRAGRADQREARQPQANQQATGWLSRSAFSAPGDRGQTVFQQLSPRGRGQGEGQGPCSPPPFVTVLTLAPFLPLPASGGSRQS